MSVPGASTTSVLLTYAATLTGWCIWQRSCIEDVSVVAPELQIWETFNSMTEAKVYGDTEHTPAWMKRATAMHSSHSTEATMGYTDTDLEHTKKHSEVMPKFGSSDGRDSCIQTADADTHHAFYRAMQRPVVDSLECPSNFSQVRTTDKLEHPIVTSMQIPQKKAEDAAIMPSAYRSIATLDWPFPGDVEAMGVELLHLDNDSYESIVNTSDVSPNSISFSPHLQCAALTVFLDVVLWILICHRMYSKDHSGQAILEKRPHQGCTHPIYKLVFKTVPVPAVQDIPESLPCETGSSENLGASLSTGSSAYKTDDGHTPKIDATSTASDNKQSHFSAIPHSNEELQARMNAIVQSRAEYRKQCEEYTFQCRANAAKLAADERRKQLSEASPLLAGPPMQPSPSPAKSLSKIEIAHYAHRALSAAKERPPMQPSPSPAKSLSKIEIAHYAHRALSAAKERSTPAKIPDTCPCWEAYEEVAPVAPCQLHFGEGLAEDKELEGLAEDKDPFSEGHAEVEVLEETLRYERDEPLMAETNTQPQVEAGNDGPSSVEPGKDCSVDSEKAEPAFDVTQIPSPTRNRAKRQHVLAEAKTQSEQELPSCKEVQKEVGGGCKSSKDNSSSNQYYKNWNSSSVTHDVDHRKPQYSSWTPQKQGGGSFQNNRRSPPSGASQHAWEVASRKAAAFEAWGVPSPQIKPRLPLGHLSRFM